MLLMAKAFVSLPLKENKIPEDLEHGQKFSVPFQSVHKTQLGENIPTQDKKSLECSCFHLKAKMPATLPAL